MLPIIGGSAMSDDWIEIDPRDKGATRVERMVAYCCPTGSLGVFGFKFRLSKFPGNPGEMTFARL